LTVKRLPPQTFYPKTPAALQSLTKPQGRMLATIFTIVSIISSDSGCCNNNFGFFVKIMSSSQTTKFAEQEGRSGEVRRLAAQRCVKAGQGTLFFSFLLSPAFLFFKPYRIQPGTRTGPCLRSGRISVLVSAFRYQCPKLPWQGVSPVS